MIVKISLGFICLIICLIFFHFSIFRRQIFEKNFKNIEKHNAEAKEGKHTFTQKINKFADMVGLI